MAQMGLITRRSTKVSWRCPVSRDPDRVPPTLSSATSDERLHKPCVAAVLGNVLELGNYPVSSCSVRLHHIAIYLRKHPVGRRPVPSFPAPRAIPRISEGLESAYAVFLSSRIPRDCILRRAVS
jgi:hypothetical protein